MVDNSIKLVDLVKIKGGKRLPKGSSLQTDENDHPYIRVRDMGSRYIPRKGLEFVPDETFTKISRYIVEKDDVIISIVGTVGLVSVIDDYFHNASQSENCAKLSGLSNDDALFLYYFLISPYGQQEISTYTVGAVQPKLPLYGIENISVPWFDSLTRRAIAHILGTLDDKIELNRQMNETLEAMAQALFKSWFVDFDPVIDNALLVGNDIPEPLKQRAEMRQAQLDSGKAKTNSEINDLFPSEFEFTEELGWIPKGWEVKQIKDLGKVVTGKTPPKRIEDAYSEVGTPFITPTDIDNQIFSIKTGRYLSDNGVSAVKNSVLKPGAICVTCIGSQMGKTIIAPYKSISNQQINSITDIDLPSRNFLFFNLKRRRDELFQLGSSGSTMPILNKGNFEKLKVIYPTRELLKNIDTYFQSILDSILENEKQSETLAKLRDTLLPKLMSGELRIPDAEK